MSLLRIRGQYPQIEEEYKAQRTTLYATSRTKFLFPSAVGIDCLSHAIKPSFANIGAAVDMLICTISYIQ